MKPEDHHLTVPWLYDFIPSHPALVVQEINLRRGKEETIVSVLQVGNGVTVNCQKSQRYSTAEKKG